MKKLLFLFLLTFVFYNVNARKFYFSSSTGNDSYTSTQAQNESTPWATLSKVQSSFASFTSGDSILFKRGDKFKGTLFIQNKSNLYFGDYALGDIPLFWGNGVPVSPLIYVVNCTNIIFSNIKISDTTISATDRTIPSKISIAFQLTNNTTGTIIKKCVMDRIGFGIYITPSSSGNTIDSCDIGNLRMIRNTPRDINPDDDYGGVPIQISSSNNKFTNNYLHDCWSVSYDYGFDGGGVEFFEEGDTIENNIIAYNTFYDCNGTFEHGSNSDGIANHPIRNNKIYYNKIINCSSLFYINNNGQYKTFVDNLQFYNNVIIQTVASRTGTTRLGSMAINDTRAGIVVFKNNIFQVSNGAAVVRSSQWTTGQLTHTNNLYKLSGGSITNFTLDVTEISTQNPIWINTSSINPIDWNYNLIDNSQAINTGVNVGLTIDAAGNPLYLTPDMGVYEKYTTVSIPCTITYGQWSACNGSFQTRPYTLIPNGCVGTPPLDSIQRACTNEIVIKSFYYNNVRRAIWIDCTRPGRMLVTNSFGNIVRTTNYVAGGQWISMNRFPTGMYFASTYGRSITFLR
jgi:hypothetical protein